MARDKGLIQSLRRELVGAAPRERGRHTEIGAWLRGIGFASRLVFLTVARCIYGYRLDAAERPVLASVTRYPVDAQLNPAGFREAWIIAGRRSGKSSGAAALAVYECVVLGREHAAFLLPGQRGTFGIASRTIGQALETFRYARSLAETYFAGELIEALESQSGGTLRFKSGIDLKVAVGSASSLRGATYVGFIAEEAAVMTTDDAEADRSLAEILSVVRFGMLAPAGAPVRRLLVITSPGTRDDIVFETGAKFANRPGGDVFVAHGPSFTWNASLNRAQLEAERLRDPRRYQREVLAEFVDSISPYLDPDSIDRAFAGRDAKPLQPQPGIEYSAAADLSARHDISALTICYRDDSGELPCVAVAGVWHWVPPSGAPLDLSTVVKDITSILNAYGVRSLVADQWAFDAVKALFKLEGIEVKQHAWTLPNKLQVFGLMRDMLIDNRISLPVNTRLARELRALDEHVLPSGQIRIAGRGRSHDDLAFSCCLAISGAIERTGGGLEAWGRVGALDEGEQDALCSALAAFRRNDRW